MGIKINYFKSYEDMSKQAANIVAETVKSKQKPILGLPTGSTPLGMYAELIKKNKAGEVDFSEVTTFNLDEYYPIKRDNPQSYYRFMFDNFFGGININPEKVSVPNGEALDPELECRQYEEKIEKSGGIDLMVLGFGPTGHIGFNEPGDFLMPYTHVEDLTEETREANKRFFDSIDEVPVKALTMGMGSILKAKKILMLVSGESKKDIFKKLLEGKIETGNPASFLYLHRDATVVADIKI